MRHASYLTQSLRVKAGILRLNNEKCIFSNAREQAEQRAAFCLQGTSPTPTLSNHSMQKRSSGPKRRDLWPCIGLKKPKSQHCKRTQSEGGCASWRSAARSLAPALRLCYAQYLFKTSPNVAIVQRDLTSWHLGIKEMTCIASVSINMASLLEMDNVEEANGTARWRILHHCCWCWFNCDLLIVKNEMSRHLCVLSF